MKSGVGEEMNLGSISTLDEEIVKGRGDIIKLKRTRNSMLNISVLVPPEILGYIFNLVVMDSTFELLDLNLSPRSPVGEGCYNLLLACYHWLEVAYAIPEVWTFWGNSLEAWEKQCIRAGSAPVDLMLYAHGDRPETLSVPLQNNLLGRTAQDTIRGIHLDSNNPDLLTAVVSLLTPSGEGTKERSIESIIFLTDLPAGSRRGWFSDLSNFFARSRLPKLRRLHLDGVIETPVWNHLTSLTTRLTSLSLELSKPSPPSTSQLLSILLSNPSLQTLSLHDAALPGDIDKSEIQVPLRRLEELVLWGKFSSVSWLLQRLGLTVVLNSTTLGFEDHPEEEDISRTIGPYIQNHMRRDTRFQEKLSIAFWLNSVHVLFISEGIPKINWIPRFHIVINRTTEQFTPDLIAPASLKHVVHLNMKHSPGMRGELFIAMPNLEVLTLRRVSLSDGFLQPDQAGPHANAKLFPSLRLLRLMGEGGRRLETTFGLPGSPNFERSSDFTQVNRICRMSFRITSEGYKRCRGPDRGVPIS